MSDSPQADEVSAPALWRLLLTWPLSGTGLSRGGSRDSSVTPAIGVTLSREIRSETPDRHWIVEAEVGILDEGLGVRDMLRLRTGPAFHLLDTRRASGRGSTITLQTQAGISLWDSEGFIPEYSVARDGTRVGLMGQVGLEGVRFTAASSGWCARVRGTVESLFLRLPDDNQPPPHPFRRWAAGLLLDIGRAW
ncbi:MAG TPA: hypothetical protein VFH68_05845 [Polyangia bacterium]|nr:hypothetical protein [Polyangia bacterium]